MEEEEEAEQNEKKLNRSGRIIIRPSGTEPLIRIMAESENEKDSEDCW